MAQENPEDELAARQDPRLYPVGRAVRSTYDADNHDTLDPIVTGLMLDLARIERGEKRAEAAPQPPRERDQGLLAKLISILSLNKRPH